MNRRKYLRKDKDQVSEIGKGKNTKHIPANIIHESTIDRSLDEANDLVSEAVLLRSKGEDEEALKNLKQVVDIQESILTRIPKTSINHKRIKDSRDGYIKAIKELEKEIKIEDTTPEYLGEYRATDRPITEGDEDLRVFKDGVVIQNKENMQHFPSMNDIVGLKDVKKQLEFEFDFVRQDPSFQELLKGTEGKKRIFLYGPSGNGKTDLGRAIAKERDINFIFVRPSDIFNKYLGSTNKALRAIFEVAKENQPSMIFIDEFDAFASSRRADDDESSRRLKNELLQLMEGFDRDPKEEVWLMMASNRPEDLDSAVLQRIPSDKQYFVDVPNIRSRRKLLRLKLTKDLSKRQKLEDIDYNKLAQITEGYSGRELTDMVQSVRRKPIVELFEENKLRKERKQQKKLNPRSITMQDFEQERINNPPGLKRQEVEALRDWSKRNENLLKAK